MIPVLAFAWLWLCSLFWIIWDRAADRVALVVNDANTSLTYKLMNITFFATHNVDVLEMWWEYAVL